MSPSLTNPPDSYVVRVRRPELLDCEVEEFCYAPIAAVNGLAPFLGSGPPDGAGRRGLLACAGEVRRLKSASTVDHLGMSAPIPLPIQYGYENIDQQVEQYRGHRELLL